MWSDPIDNALANMQSIIDQQQRGHEVQPDQWERAQGSLTRAREIRAKEDEHGRLVTPEDRW